MMFRQKLLALDDPAAATMSVTAVQEDKRRLRKKAREVRKAVPPGEQEEAAARLAKGLPHHPLLKEVRPAGVLVPTRHNDEIDTWPLAHALEGRGWTIHRPRVITDTQDFEVVPWATPGPLFPGAHEVPEPPPRAKSVDPSSLHLVLVPGLAFTRGGDRLGTGAGYFDRFFARLAEQGHRPIKIGIAYRAQILDRVPLEPHDVPLDGLQVEEGSIVCDEVGGGHLQ